MLKIKSMPLWAWYNYLLLTVFNDVSTKKCFTIIVILNMHTCIYKIYKETNIYTYILIVISFHRIQKTLVFLIVLFFYYISIIIIIIILLLFLFNFLTNSKIQKVFLPFILSRVNYNVQ